MIKIAPDEVLKFYQDEWLRQKEAKKMALGVGNELVYTDVSEVTDCARTQYTTFKQLSDIIRFLETKSGLDKDKLDSAVLEYKLDDYSISGIGLSIRVGECRYVLGRVEGVE